MLAAPSHFFPVAYSEAAKNIARFIFPLLGYLDVV
jgi:hypothetical protein